MAKEKKHIEFTAIDIEKYHEGLLTSKERHALEKAALDDSFLADALEGYSTEGVNATNDIADLKKRLLEKTEKGKIVQILVGRKTAFEWLKVAAMIVLIAGAGLLVYQFAFNKKTKEVAQNEEANTGTELKDTDQTKGTVTLKSHEKVNTSESPTNSFLKENKRINETSSSNINSSFTKKIKEEKSLSPLLLVRDQNNAKLIIADGYHRLCTCLLYTSDAADE